jgi:hypothetical protein
VATANEWAKPLMLRTTVQLMVTISATSKPLKVGADDGRKATPLTEKGETMKLSEFLREIKVRGEVVISIEDAKKILSGMEAVEEPDVKILHIDAPIPDKILNLYGGITDERKAD